MGHAIPDIPRIYTALAEWMSCCLFIILLGPKIKKVRFALLSVAYLLLLSFYQSFLKLGVHVSVVLA